MSPAADDSYKYSLPVETENRRLAGQHHGFKIAMGNRLVVAPIDKTQKGLRIMDGGTSDGYWLNDFRNELTDPDSCELLGTDVTGERFPEIPPHGVELHAYSSLGPFPDDWYSSFDLVHQRLTLAGLGNKSKDCVEELMRLVKPGGWIQLVELDYNWIEPNPPAVKKLGALVSRLAEGMGSDMAYRNGGMEKWIRESGFIRVGSMAAPVCIGATCPEPRWRAQTCGAFTFTAQQLVKACRAFPGGLKVMSDEEADNLGVQLEKELSEYGGYFPCRVVWGMRPLK